MKGYIGIAVILPFLIMAKIFAVINEVVTTISGRVLGWVYNKMIST